MTSYELVVMSGPDGGLVLPMQNGRQTIGRSPVAGLTINDPSIEPHHGIIEWVPPSLSVESLGEPGSVPIHHVGLDFAQVRVE